MVGQDESKRASRSDGGGLVWVVGTVVECG